MLNPKIPVASEGYPFIGFAAFCTLLTACLQLVIPTCFLLLLTLFILCFFRDPERFTPTDKDGLVSPADGKVIIIEEVQSNPFTDSEACKVSIFMNVFNVHVNRIPFSGTVDRVLYKPGCFYSADSKRGGLENEYCASILTTADGQKIAFVQLAGLIARRIICWLEPGDIARKGSRFGLIRFGSRVDLYLPPDTKINVKIGDKVRAGESIVGFLRQAGTSPQ